MSHSLARKFDKIVSKLSNKPKTPKPNGSDTTDYYYHSHEDLSVRENETSQREKSLQETKTHLGNSLNPECRQHPISVSTNQLMPDPPNDSVVKRM